MNFFSPQKRCYIAFDVRQETGIAKVIIADAVLSILPKQSDWKNIAVISLPPKRFLLFPVKTESQKEQD